MVLQYIVQNSEKCAYRKRNNEQKARVGTAAALLTSFIADADVVTDWIYFAEIVNRDNEEDTIPSWIRVLQLVSCICGTFSWLAISSDGRMMDWLRQAVWCFLSGLLGVAFTIFYCIPASTLFVISCGKIEIASAEGIYSAHDKFNQFFREGFRVSSGGLLIFGILTEDLPQIIVTFLIEDAIGSLGDGGAGISRSAYLNLIVAIFDILHKLASAWDDRKLYIGTGAGILTFTGHKDDVMSLARVGMDRIISASCDGTARLWDIATGKTIKIFNVGANNWFGTIVKLGNDRILATSSRSDGNMKVFDIHSGECLKTIDNGGNELCTIVSNNGEYFLTSKSTTHEITRWDATTLEAVQTYPKGAHFLMIPEDDNGDHFVSANCPDGEDGGGGYPILWDVSSGSIIRNFNVNNNNNCKVTAMCVCNGDTFLVASYNGEDTSIDMFTVGDSDPIKSMTIKRCVISRLTSVGGDRFVTARRYIFSETVELWDISSGTRLHTFKGHSDSIFDIIHLPEQDAIATASVDKTVKVWPIIPKEPIADDGDAVEGWSDDNADHRHYHHHHHHPPDIDDFEHPESSRWP